VWSRIAVAGHSQGAGHAAYIAKKYEVDRVLMFSGPQDYFDDLAQPAAWEKQPGATAPSRFFAFLNLHDPYKEEHQAASCAVLMDLAKPETLTLQPGDQVKGQYRILVNTEEKNPHGTTILPEFEDVWKYMANVDVR
jgi:pimeloyl-ACP methyl ester carboxylesterase